MRSVPRTESNCCSQKKVGSHRDGQCLHHHMRNRVAGHNCCTTPKRNVYNTPTSFTSSLSTSLLTTSPLSCCTIFRETLQDPHYFHTFPFHVPSHHPLPSCPPTLPLSLPKINFSSFENPNFLVLGQIMVSESCLGIPLRARISLLRSSSPYAAPLLRSSSVQA